MRQLLAAITLAVAAGSCLAHGELPTPIWCANGHPVPVSTFEFSGRWLSRPPRCNAPSDASGNQDTRECGQFDDDYGTTRHFASQTCQVHARRGVGDIGSVVFVIDQPASFLDDDHHALYRLSHGLKGTCVRCEARALPAPPPR
jgi:hypothetical protein